MSLADSADLNDEPEIGGYPLSEMVRRIRRTADMSQRQLADWTGVSASMIAAIETGGRSPSLPLLQKMLRAAQYQLVIVDNDGRLVLPLLVWTGVEDLAGRRLPAHLDTILDPSYGDWWGYRYGLTAPPETFRRSRAYRDYVRRQSQWEVRVAQFRGARRPEPPPGDDGWPDSTD